MNGEYGFMRIVIAILLSKKHSREGPEKDRLFRNEVARRAFEAFTKRVVIDDEDTSIMQLILAYTYINSILQYISRKLAEIRKGGQDPFVLRSRYRTFLSIAVESLQTEVIKTMQKTLWKDATEHNAFLNEFGMLEGEDE